MHDDALNDNGAVSQPQSSEDNGSVDPPTSPILPSRAPKDISSAIDVSNILPSRTRRTPHASVCIPKAMITTSTDPQTYTQATRRDDSEEWIKAMDKELSALERMNVWEEVEVPAGQHALGTTWVYKRKTNTNGELAKYNARLCAQGFSQIEGVDYCETYAPTGRLAALRTALLLGASEDMEIIQMDAVGAFLNGIPKEILYIRPPKGYICKSSNPNTVLKLNKSLYGLKQSPRCWYRQLKEFFESINFKASLADPCFFLSADPLWKCGAYVHVDDLCVIGKNTDRFKQLISARFAMEDLGECSYYLGMRLVRDHQAKTITLLQDKYIEAILVEYGMEDCKTVNIPMILNSHLVPATDEEQL